MAGETASKRVQDTGDAGMNNILALLNTIVGTDTTTKQTSDTAPLRAIMDQIAASGGNQGKMLLESIFQQAAGKVPQLMGNTFNATGSRAPAGQMAGTLQKLMADITVQAQAQMAQQEQARQQILMQGANGLANATRTTTQQNRSGASGLLQQGSQALAAAKLIKEVTGVDVAKKGKELIQGLLAPDTPGLSLPDVTSGMTLGFSGAEPGAASLTGTTALTPGSIGDITQFFSSQDSEGTSDLASLFSGAGSTFSLGDGAGGDISSMNSMPVDTNAPTIGSDQTDWSASNFSTGGSANAAPADTTMQDIGTALKVASYVDNPEKAKDVFDFSDGNLQDDVGDVTDAGAIAFPPLALVRPGLQFQDAFLDSNVQFFEDPGQWFQNLGSGEEPVTKWAIDTTLGAADSVVQTGDMIGRAGETVGNAVGDVFESIGDLFGW